MYIYIYIYGQPPAPPLLLPPWARHAALDFCMNRQAASDCRKDAMLGESVLCLPCTDSDLHRM